MRAARPSSATMASGVCAARLGDVLRRALRDHRAGLCDERPTPQLPVDHDLPSDPEEIGDRTGVPNRDRRRRPAADVLEPEVQPARVRVSGHRALHHSCELHLARAPGEACSARWTGCRRPRSRCRGGTPRARRPREARSRDARGSPFSPRQESSPGEQKAPDEALSARPLGRRLGPPGQAAQSDSPVRQPSQTASRSAKVRSGSRYPCSTQSEPGDSSVSASQ